MGERPSSAASRRRAFLLLGLSIAAVLGLCVLVARFADPGDPADDRARDAAAPPPGASRRSATAGRPRARPPDPPPAAAESGDVEEPPIVEVRAQITSGPIQFRRPGASSAPSATPSESGGTQPPEQPTTEDGGSSGPRTPGRAEGPTRSVRAGLYDATRAREFLGAPDERESSDLLVVDERLSPIGDAWISVGNPATREYRHARSDARGRVAAGGPWPEGATDLQAMQRGFLRHRSQVTPPDLMGAVLVMSLGNRLSGTVAHVRGEPADGAKVYVVVEGEQHLFTGTADGDGRFEITGLPGGRGRLFVEQGTGLWEVVEPVSLATTRLRIVLPSWRTAAGPEPR